MVFGILQHRGLEMDKENGKANEGNSGSSKVTTSQDPSSLLDAASLFGGEYLVYVIFTYKMRF